MASAAKADKQDGLGGAQGRPPKAVAPKALLGRYDHPHNDLLDQWVLWEDEGRWWEDVLTDVPLDQIDIPAVWAPERFDRALALTRKTRKMPPVHLYQHENGRFEVSDGIHRCNVCNVCKVLGYRAVPAIATELRTTAPPVQPDPAEVLCRRAIDRATSFSCVLRGYVLKGNPWLTTLAVEPGAFKLGIEFSNDATAIVQVAFVGDTFTAKVEGMDLETTGRVHPVCCILGGALEPLHAVRKA